MMYFFKKTCIKHIKSQNLTAVHNEEIKISHFLNLTQLHILMHLDTDQFVDSPSQQRMGRSFYLQTGSISRQFRITVACFTSSQAKVVDSFLLIQELLIKRLQKTSIRCIESLTHFSSLFQVIDIWIWQTIMHRRSLCKKQGVFVFRYFDADL